MRALNPYKFTLAFEQDFFGKGFVGELGPSVHFLYCHVIGVLIALHFVGAAAVQDKLGRWLHRFSGLVRGAAKQTLSIYLFHFPILLFTTAGLSFMRPGPLRTGLSIAIAVLACFALGMVFEDTRYAWRIWLKRMAPPSLLAQLRDQRA